MGLHDLEFRHVETVAGLDCERVAVTEHTSQEDVLDLIKREAVCDVALLSPLGEVVVIGLTGLGRRCVGLVLDAVAHRVEGEVVEDLIEQPAVAFSPATLTDHRQAVERGQVAA